MTNPLLMRLEQYAPLEQDDRERLDTLIGDHLESYAPRQDVIREGDRADRIHLIVSGMAARYKLLPNGNRQIMAVLIPGDFCDMEVIVFDRMDHCICAISEAVCALVPARRMREELAGRSALTRALWWSAMTESAVLRERIIDHGRRDARERLAHLFYEMLLRYRVIEQAEGDRIAFPLTQEELADASGLTPVHVNRTLKQLRNEGLIALKERYLTVLDPAGLRKVAGFNPNYLHLRGAERQGQPLAAFEQHA